jgi:enoyl-CoA hydratase/carnithine racemase
MTQVLTITHEGPVTHLTLNRPKKANSLSPELTESLIDAFEAAKRDQTRLVVLSGAGKGFCSGFDLSGFDDLRDGDLVLGIIRIETLLQLVYHAPFPTLALAHGRVMGAGADLFAACSQRIATPDASFRMPGLAFGIVLGTRRLAARIGPDATRAIQNATRTFDAAQALALGFATDLAEQSSWPDLIAAQTKAAQILPQPSTTALFRATLIDSRAEDMADLARSAAAPGLKMRIAQFRQRTLKAAGKIPASE